MNSTYLFLFGCIGTRLLLTFLAKTQIEYLPYMGFAAAIMSLGFFYIYFTRSRPVGIETGGKLIWWNRLRPLHGFLYGVFAYMAIIQQSRDAWKVLLVDTAIGFGAFMNHHYLS
jgi:hypothetical protein